MEKTEYEFVWLLVLTVAGWVWMRVCRMAEPVAPERPSHSPKPGEVEVEVVADEPAAVKLVRSPNDQTDAESESMSSDEDQLVQLCGPRPAGQSRPAASPGSSLLSLAYSSEDMSVELTPRTSHERAIATTPRYNDEVFAHLRTLEEQHAPVDYMITARGIDTTSRAAAVDWMAHVVCQYDLGPETLHLAVAYLDRFAASEAGHFASRSDVMLAATSCMLIADKFDTHGSGLDHRVKHSIA